MAVRTQMRSAATYNALRGVRRANGLLAVGLHPQDRIGVLEDNTRAVVVAEKHAPEIEAILDVLRRRRAYDLFGNATYQGYGRTEVLPIATMGPRQ